MSKRNNNEHRENNNEHRVHNNEHRVLNNEHRVHSIEHRVSSSEHRENNNEHRETLNKHKENNSKHSESDEEDRESSNEYGEIDSELRANNSETKPRYVNPVIRRSRYYRKSENLWNQNVSTTNDPLRYLRRPDGRPKNSNLNSPNGYYRRNEDYRNPRIVIGSGHGGNFKVCQPRHGNYDVESPNKRITGVFISRFGPSTTPAQIAVHVRKETGLTVRPEKITTKYQNYSSFYIPAESRARDALMDSHTWPRGILVKPFFS